MKIKQILRPIVKCKLNRMISSNIVLVLAQLAPKHAQLPGKDESIQILKNAGYNFLPIFNNTISSLQESSLDVSFIIPVYNSEKYLSRCLTSILEQKTRYKFEVICINDGSTDDSVKILEIFQAKYLNLVVISQKNGGIANARNRGIQNAKGEYIGFIDNDDYVSEGYIDTCMNAAMKYNADIIQTGIREVDSFGRTISKTEYVDTVIEPNSTLEKKNLVSGYIWDGVIRKRLFEKVRFPEGFWYEDMITRMLLMRISNCIVKIHTLLYNKVYHGDNASTILWKSSNIKCADDYWLAINLIDYSVNYLGCKYDEFVYNELLWEFGPMLSYRTMFLNKKAKKALFSLASEYMKAIHCPPKKYKSIYKNEYLDSLLTSNFNKWSLLAVAYKLLKW